MRSAIVCTLGIVAVSWAALSKDSNPQGLTVRKIDTHSHVYPDFYRQAVIDAGWTPGPDGNAAPPNWTVEAHLKFMDDNNIEKSIVSCSSPGTFLFPNDTDRAVALTQQFNNFTADLRRAHPDRFGFFASLPLPSIPDALDEIDRALELGADGFVFMSNYHGLYHGDPRLEPIYEKLNATGTVIFVHPTIPCPHNTPIDVSGTERLDYVAPLMSVFNAPTLEFIFDTARTVADALLSGMVEAHANIKWIIPHCGGAIPSVLDRFIRIASILGPKEGSDREVVAYNTTSAIEVMNQQYWFDTAGFSMQSQIWSMARMFGPEKFTYGSDVPFTAWPAAMALTKEINATLPELFTDGGMEMILRSNALGLVAR
jgi:6-methylsalicylate decarboxylase